MSLLTLREVSKTFIRRGRPHDVIRDVSFDLDYHQIIAIVGRSGCGKSTLLKLIAGLERSTRGTIAFNGTVVDRPDRSRALVSQRYSLFPWLTAAGNIRFGVSRSTLPSPSAVNAEVDELLRRIGLDGHGDRYPHQLSGGQQQRIALARTVAADPDILLLDEPFGALDPVTRLSTQRLLVELFSAIRQSVLVVTHDIPEAVRIADRIIVLAGHPTTVVADVPIPAPRRGLNGDLLSEPERGIAEDVFDLLRSASA